MNFKNAREAEKYLEEHYVNKVLEVTYYTLLTEKKYVGKLDRLSIDDATKNPPVIVLIFNDGSRFEVEKDEFNEQVKLLN